VNYNIYLVINTDFIENININTIIITYSFTNHLFTKINLNYFAIEIICGDIQSKHYRKLIGLMYLKKNCNFFYFYFTYIINYINSIKALQQKYSQILHFICGISV
jgi:hypothetical protein